MKPVARIIAFYLPQYHPIPENDKWWGKGFTEWTNVGKAKSLFKNHYQPRVPADLGYYDLRVPETRKLQADLAEKYGIEGFCYWHYWFGNGKRLLERPFNEVLESKEPDFPFCLAWANESWKGFDHGITNRNVLIEQLYPGVEDYTNHFYAVLPAFKDNRYITIDEKPVFMIYKPLQHPNIKEFMNLWQELAVKNGLKGIHFIAHNNEYSTDTNHLLNLGFDGVNTVRISDYLKSKSFLKKYGYFKKLFLKIPLVFPYKRALKYFLAEEDKKENVYPSIISGWDHTPRSGKEGLVLSDYTPNSFKKHVEQVWKFVENKPSEKRIIFLKSWNEWAEGNYIEPDLKFGKKFLEVIKSIFIKNI